MARSDSTRNKATLESPLRLHAGGQWYVRRRGRFFYLGRDYDAALKAYLDGKDFYDAGRKPPAADDRTTIKELVNHYLIDAERRVATGELAKNTWKDYHRAAAEIVACFGRLAIVADLTPDDFATLRAKLATGRSLHTLANKITQCRIIFNHAEGAELVSSRIRFGKSFSPPSAKNLKKARKAKGRRDLTPQQIHQWLAKSDTISKTWILLGLQAGFGVADLAELPLSAIDLDGGWIDFPRVKTGVDRHIPLWAETVEAIRDYLAVRPKPKPAAAGFLYINRRRIKWHRDSIGHTFADLRDASGVAGSHYDLRRTFRTIADATLDRPACDIIMGHAADDDDMGARYRQHVGDGRLRAVVEHVRDWLFRGGA